MSFPKLRKSVLHVVSILIVTTSLSTAQDKSSAGPANETRNPASHLKIDQTAPRVIRARNPEYSPDARAKRIQGTVLLSFTVGIDGRPRDIHVKRSLSPDLDQEAVNCLKTWKFEPATRNGKPFAADIDIEINFKLY